VAARCTGEGVGGEGVGGNVGMLQELRGGESMRAASIEEKGVADGGLTMKRQRWWRSDRNQRVEGVSGGRSR
jgi:hypothetical protein